MWRSRGGWRHEARYCHCTGKYFEFTNENLLRPCVEWVIPTQKLNSEQSKMPKLNSNLKGPSTLHTVFQCSSTWSCTLLQITDLLFFSFVKAWSNYIVTLDSAQSPESLGQNLDAQAQQKLSAEQKENLRRMKKATTGSGVKKSPLWS